MNPLWRGTLTATPQASKPGAAGNAVTCRQGSCDRRVEGLHVDSAFALSSGKQYRKEEQRIGQQVDASYEKDSTAKHALPFISPCKTKALRMPA